MTMETETPTPTAEAPTSISRIEEFLRSKAGGSVRSEDVQEANRDIPIGTINASLQQLRDRRETTGIIRVAPGTFAYRPDQIAEDIGGDPAKSRDVSFKNLVAEVIRNAGKPMSMTDVQNELSRMGYDLHTKQVNQAVNSAAKSDPDLEKVTTGVYRYTPSSGGVENSKIAESIPDEAFETEGLRVVARSQDGARICVDENGIAWKVSVRVETRLV